MRLISCYLKVKSSINIFNRNRRILIFHYSWIEYALGMVLDNPYCNKQINSPIMSDHDHETVSYHTNTHEHSKQMINYIIETTVCWFERSVLWTLSCRTLSRYRITGGPVAVSGIMHVQWCACTCAQFIVRGYTLTSYRLGHFCDGDMLLDNIRAES